MPPVVVAAGIGAAAGIGGGLLSAKAQKKAANKAADTSLQVAQANNALQGRIFDQTSATLNPYVSRGNEAGTAINSLLGISGSLAPAQGGAGSGVPGAPAAPNTAWTQGALNAMLAVTGPKRTEVAMGIADPAARLAYLQSVAHEDEQAAYSAYAAANPQAPPPVQVVQPTGGAAPATGGTANNHANAFQNYLNSTGYQFQVDQGNQAINQGYAAKGALQSGAAMKALQTYGQNTATSFFKDYLGLLANQQGVGLSGASAMAGVGQNYANSVSANNNNAGSAAANAHLAAGNANAGLYGNIAGGIAGIANAFGTSYRPPPYYG